MTQLLLLNTYNKTRKNSAFVASRNCNFSFNYCKNISANKFWIFTLNILRMFQLEQSPPRSLTPCAIVASPPHRVRRTLCIVQTLINPLVRRLTARWSVVSRWVIFLSTYHHRPSPLGPSPFTSPLFLRSSGRRCCEEMKKSLRC